MAESTQTETERTGESERERESRPDRLPARLHTHRRSGFIKSTNIQIFKHMPGERGVPTAERRKGCVACANNWKII